MTRKLLLVLTLSCLTASCAHSPTKTVTVHVPEPVLPPANLMQPCVSPGSDGTVAAELSRLSWIVNCERGDKAAMRTWAASFTKK